MVLLSCQTHVSAQSGQNGAESSAILPTRHAREVSRTAFEVPRSDSGTDAVCRATAEPKAKPVRKAAESDENIAPLAA